jgi:hypothetical protein
MAQETLQQVNTLQRGRVQSVAYTKPDYHVMKDVNPNPVNDGTQQLYGTQVFNEGRGWQEMRPNWIKRDSRGVTITDTLYYRSNLGVPQRNSADQRILTPSVTQPAASARFRDGRTGDVYGRS